MRTPALRLAILISLLGAGVAAGVFMARRPPGPDDTRLAWIATAHQFGPVGYRDPAGAISPDGRWIAYSEGRFLRVQPIDGGAIVEFPPGPAQIRYLTWRPDSRAIATDGDPAIGGSAVYDIAARTRGPLFSAPPPALRQPVWSADGRAVAALVNAREGSELWRFAAEPGRTPIDGARGVRVRALLGSANFPVWAPQGEIACLSAIDGRSRLTLPCGVTTIRTDPDLDAYGPMAFSPDGATAYVALANARGTVDLWAVPVAGGRARQLTFFSRDTYAPTVAADGAVVFKVQSYRTAIAMADAHGGPTSPLSTFQSETPSWDPTGQWLGITYGTWRRVPDDAKYPDIAQDAGIIGVDPLRPATGPARIVHDSASEDQSLCWSPNGTWIAFHSHKDQSDDIWLRPADGGAEPRRVSFLGRGAETGWPRWSPDGGWLLFDGASRQPALSRVEGPALSRVEGPRRSVIYVAGVDQERGTTNGEAREIPVSGLDAEMSHAEWLPDSLHIAAIAKEAPGRHVIFTVGRDGGDAHVVHRFASEHDAPGLAVSPDGRAVAFIAPSADGFFQVFRMPLEAAGGSPVQITTDRTNKTQPAWSPDGRRVAFTVWNYDAQFWKYR